MYPTSWLTPKSCKPQPTRLTRSPCLPAGAAFLCRHKKGRAYRPAEKCDALLAASVSHSERTAERRRRCRRQRGTTTRRLHVGSPAGTGLGVRKRIAAGKTQTARIRYLLLTPGSLTPLGAVAAGIKSADAENSHLGGIIAINSSAGGIAENRYTILIVLGSYPSRGVHIRTVVHIPAGHGTG